MYCDKRDHLIGKIILDNYKIQKKIDENWIIKICSGIDLTTKKEYIIKLVRKNLLILQERRLINSSHLEKEVELLINQKLFILPELIKYGYEFEYNYLILSSPKISLEQLFIFHKKSFSLKRACELALNILDTIEILHNHNIIHRDLKPQVLSSEIKGKKTEIIKLFDFGFWKYYRNKNGHIPYKQYKKIIGKNLLFCSINSLNGIELSRRDDLESLAYMLIYFIKGALPWENNDIKNKEERIKKIIEMKKNMGLEILCEKLPEEIRLFISYTKNLKFEEEPEYNYLKNLLKVVINTKNSDKNYFFNISNKLIKYKDYYY